MALGVGADVLVRTAVGVSARVAVEGWAVAGVIAVLSLLSCVADNTAISSAPAVINTMAPALSALPVAGVGGAPEGGCDGGAT